MRKLIFIHHSCGENWLSDGGGRLGAEMAANGYYVSDTNYEWGPDGIGNTTDIGHWWSWFRGPDSARYLDALYRDNGRLSDYTRPDMDVPGENEIVMFKSCFPNSSLKGNPGDPVPAIGANPLRGQPFHSEHFTAANAKGIYLDLLAYFRTRPDKLFIAVTAPPLIDGAHASNARAFNQWLVHEWLKDYPDQNVAVFDFYNVLTSNGGEPGTSDIGLEKGNHHRLWGGCPQHVVDLGSPSAGNTCKYPASPDDDHPNPAGNRKATREFLSILDYFFQRWQKQKPC